MVERCLRGDWNEVYTPFMIFRRLPFSVRCALAFVLVYGILATFFYVKAYIHVIHADPLVDDYAELAFIPYFEISLPGALVAVAAMNLHFTSTLFTPIVPIVSALFYCVIGAAIGGLWEWLSARKRKKNKV